MYSGQSIADERRLNLSQARLRTGAVRWSGSKVIGRRRSRRPVSSDPHCWMSRFLRCGCHRRPQSELQPSIWAGRGNVWEQIPELTDEFTGRSINGNKWLLFSPWSPGTRPGLFLPSNVTIRNDSLHLTCREERVPKGAPPGHQDWTTAAIFSRGAALYGYFECRLRASDSALLSRFTLSKRTENKWKEVSIFSYSGAEAHREHVFMDAVLSPGMELDPADSVRHPLTKIIFDMPTSPVTIGFDWSPDYLKTYVDGQIIRHLENKHWHTPMHMGFMLETAPDLYGLPERGSSRRATSSFQVMYSRTWRRFPSPRQEVTPGIE